MLTATPQRACAECGKLFFPHSANQTYHDDLCRQRAYRQRSKKRRAPKELTLSDFFSTYFAQVLQDVTPATAEVIWKGAQRNPTLRYAVTSWTDPDNTIVPANIEIVQEEKDGIEYYNVHYTQHSDYKEESVTVRFDTTIDPELQAIYDKINANRQKQA